MKRKRTNPFVFNNKLLPLHLVRNDSYLRIIMNEIINILKINNLKVTPQRIAVLNALLNLAHHPTAELIIDFIRIHHSNIATGTIYNTLETFVNKGIDSMLNACFQVFSN